MSPQQTTVKRRRGRPRRVGPPTVAKRWHTVDWEQTDAAIGQQMGVTRQRVNQIRQILGKKRTPPPLPSEIAGKWLQRNRKRAPQMTSVEAAEAAGVTLHAMRNAASKMRIRFRRDRKPAAWRNMPINWSLPAGDIQEIWRLPDNTAANMRSRGEVPQQKWHKAHDAGNRAYQTALRREHEKAKQYWRKHSDPYKSLRRRKAKSR